VDTDLDSIDYLIVAAVFERNSKVWMEFIQSDCFFKDEPLCKNIITRVVE